jgi:hypothetical protein
VKQPAGTRKVLMASTTRDTGPSDWTGVTHGQRDPVIHPPPQAPHVRNTVANPIHGHPLSVNVLLASQPTAGEVA